MGVGVLALWNCISTEQRLANWSLRETVFCKVSPLGISFFFVLSLIEFCVMFYSVLFVRFN